MPIALISIMGKDRQSFISQSGLPPDMAEAGGVPRELSVCSQVVARDEPLVVEDLARDRRFSANPLLREKGLRFYAGVPLRTPSGHVIGSLCVLDYKPRKFSDQDQRLLQVSAEEVMDVLNSHAPQPAEAIPAK
jgi:GAF domain-containing protein